MPTNQVSDIIEHLRRTLVLWDRAGLTDGQLLADYLRRHDKAALAALVRRHGPMVWGVCRRILHNYPDAEDAFQATFLVLVRRAASIVPSGMVANWLYGVAHQTALKTRATIAKRRARERQVTVMPEPVTTDRDHWTDLQPLLDQELSRLPDKYRVAIVMCDLEGKTRKEAARQLGVPEGTLAARLARGRVKLAKRLARHGLAMSGGAVGLMLSENAASASVPISVVSNTIKAASLFAAGQAAAVGLISARVVALTEGVLKTMLMTKFKTSLAVILVLGMVALGSTVAVHYTAAGPSMIAADAGRIAKVLEGEEVESKWSEEWQPLAAVLAKDHGLCGVVVDHNTGCVWINVIGKGVYCSPAGGNDFQPVKGYHLSGYNETPGCWLLDPTGKSRRAITALVHGCQCSVSQDHLATWICMSEMVKHVNWCAVDWTDPDLKFVLALKHNSGGLLLGSDDGGKTFHEIGKGFATGWVFDGHTAVVAEAKSKDRPNPSLMRTADGGKTFKPCGQYSPVGAGSRQALPKWRDGVLYWLVEGGLIASSDKGETWQKLSDVAGQYGPVFGRDARHMFVLTNAGIIESKDGGARWLKPIAPPKEWKGIPALSWVEYDPPRDVLYLLTLGSDLYRLSRRDANSNKESASELKAGQKFEGEIDLESNEGVQRGEGFTVGYRAVVPITLKAGANVSASATVVGKKRTVGLLLKDPTGKTLGSTKMEPGTARITVQEVNANGKYTIEVYSDMIGPYTLRVADTADELDKKTLEDKIRRLEKEQADLREKLKAKAQRQ